MVAILSRLQYTDMTYFGEQPLYSKLQIVSMWTAGYG